MDGDSKKVKIFCCMGKVHIAKILTWTSLPIGFIEKADERVEIEHAEAFRISDSRLILNRSNLLR